MSSTTHPPPTRDQAINIRATRQQRDLIDHAASVLGKSRSDFMLESACLAAEDALLDRTYFVLDPDSFDQLTELLENPPDPPEGLREFLARKAPWE
ncbi:MAG: DUF1778 domain-containing protein [Thermomicrobiales bacterium]|nr:DUF1778 domain-containing protein [Thermomicrobiales bacterium]